MKKKKIIYKVIPIIVFFFGFFTPLLNAEQFTFKVLIELNDIPSQLKDWKLEITFIDGFTKNLWTVKQPFSVYGSFKKTLTIKFNAPPGKNPKDAKYYRLNLWIKNPVTKKFDGVLNVMKKNGAYPYDDSKPFHAATAAKKISNANRRIP